jgi:hypothetical protein
MAPRFSRRANTKSYSNVMSTKNIKFCSDQDDVDSSTTAASDSGSEQDRILQGTQQTPLRLPEKTSLKSLCNKATLFVPTEELGPVDMAMMMPPCMPTPGKDCLAALIHSTLGGEVWNLNMMDGMMPYSQQWYTAVEIVIPELDPSMCHLATSGDANAVDLARQSHQSKAISSLKQALQGMSGAILQPAEDGAQICVEFCAGNRDKLCREFSHFGCCPRGATCRWEHALIELFMINIVLAPLGQWAEDRHQHGAPASKPTSRWQPRRPPMPPAQETSASSHSDTSSHSETDLSDTTPSSKGASEMKPLLPDVRPKNPRLTSRKKWSDIQDESDDDLDSFSFGRTP